jgi:hypothetical protein
MLLDIFDVTLWQIARSNHAVAEIFDAICQIAAALATPGCSNGAFVSVILAIPSMIVLEFLMLTLKGGELIVWHLIGIDITRRTWFTIRLIDRILADWGLQLLLLPWPVDHGTTLAAAVSICRISSAAGLPPALAFTLIEIIAGTAQAHLINPRLARGSSTRTAFLLQPHPPLMQ